VNGAERAPVSAVDVTGDSVTFRFDWYDSAILASVSNHGNAMSGEWVKAGSKGASHMPFRATRGERDPLT